MSQQTGKTLAAWGPSTVGTKDEGKGRGELVMQFCCGQKSR